LNRLNVCLSLFFKIRLLVVNGNATALAEVIRQDPGLLLFFIPLCFLFFFFTLGAMSDIEFANPLSSPSTPSSTTQGSPASPRFPLLHRISPQLGHAIDTFLYVLHQIWVLVAAFLHQGWWFLFGKHEEIMRLEKIMKEARHLRTWANAGVQMDT